MPRLHVRLIALLSIPLLLLTSGCMRMKADYEILSESKVQVAMDIGMRNDAVAELGQEMPDFCEEAGALRMLGATTEEYADEDVSGYSGCRLTATAPISELSDEALSLVLEDDVWRFGMEGGDSGGTEGMSADMLSDFQIRVTFPGNVLTHSGGSTVDGTTVTWADPADLFTAEGLKATAENGGVGSLPWLWIALGALIVLGAVVAVILLQRKKRNVPTQPGGPWQGGYGPEYRQGQQYPPQRPGAQYPPQGPGPQYPQGQPYPQQGPPPQQHQYPPQGQPPQGQPPQSPWQQGSQE